MLNIFSKQVTIMDGITINIPTLREVVENEKLYYSIVSIFNASPNNYKVFLSDIGIKYSEINDYQMFEILFNALKELDTSILFGDLDFNDFHVLLNTENNQIEFVKFSKDDDGNNELDLVINRLTYNLIGDVIRKMNLFKKDTIKSANDANTEYQIEKERRYLARRKNKEYESQLEPIIVSLVNTEEFKYNYETVMDLTIYQFNKSLEQIQNKKEYDNLMHGIYSGSVDADKIDKTKLTWISIPKN